MSEEKRGLIERISAVRAAVKPLVLSEQNPHGRYKYAGIDQVYDMLRPIMAAQQVDLRIDILTSETERVPNAKGGESVWLRLSAALNLACPEEAEDPVTRHLFLPLTGPQSFEAAISYLAKQFLRQRFQLATGEDDADATAPQDAVPEQERQPAQDGRWVQGEDLAYEWDGEGEPDDAAYRSLYALLAKALQPREWTPAEAEAAHKIAEANRKIIGTLPDGGRKKIEEYWSALPDPETGEVA